MPFSVEERIVCGSLRIGVSFLLLYRVPPVSYEMFFARERDA